MPDTHAGMGMPIGGVIATKGVVIPNAVGVDIGCGMAYVGTNIPVKVLKETMTGNGNLVQGIVGDIMRSIPVGFAHHKTPMPCYTMPSQLCGVGKSLRRKCLGAPQGGCPCKKRRADRDSRRYGLLQLCGHGSW